MIHKSNNFQNPGVGNTLFNSEGGGTGNFYQGQHYEEPKEEDEENEESGENKEIIMPPINRSSIKEICPEETISNNKKK